MVDKIGNDHADALARKGALAHDFDHEAFVAARARRDLASSVQQMMVEIMEARAVAQPVATTELIILDDDGQDYAQEDEVISVSTTDESDADEQVELVEISSGDES